MKAPVISQRGGFAMGLVAGLLAGLALALGVALYITKAPIPRMRVVTTSASAVTVMRRTPRRSASWMACSSSASAGSSSGASPGVPSIARATAWCTSRAKRSLSSVVSCPRAWVPRDPAPTRGCTRYRPASRRRPQRTIGDSSHAFA